MTRKDWWVLWTDSSFYKVKFVYILATSGEVERIIISIRSLPNIALFYLAIGIQTQKYISKKSYLAFSLSPSPCMQDDPGADNVNSCSGFVRQGSFRPEVKRLHLMRQDGQVSIQTHWTRRFCILTHLTPPGGTTALIVYPHWPASSSLRSEWTHFYAAILGTSCCRDISPSSFLLQYTRWPAFFP